ncbi:MAG: PorT family protein, partial [Alistipes sp.]|nr:PorT family protein [Alistipes sp.]
ERTISSERHHRLPVRAGVTLRYNLSDRWAIESGVTYTKLSSDSSLGDSANYYDERTTLHYIGIPVNAVYNIYLSRRLTVYASAGVMAEKAVSGAMRTNYFLNGENINTLHSDVSIKPLQWSVNAAAGVQYNLSRWVALYAEPSIGYHFDNGTAIETLYNERPLDFNLGVGLRFTLR